MSRAKTTSWFRLASTSAERFLISFSTTTTKCFWYFADFNDINNNIDDKTIRISYTHTILFWFKFLFLFLDFRNFVTFQVFSFKTSKLVYFPRLPISAYFGCSTAIACHIYQVFQVKCAYSSAINNRKANINLKRAANNTINTHTHTTWCARKSMIIIAVEYAYSTIQKHINRRIDTAGASISTSRLERWALRVSFQNILETIRLFII